MARASSVIRGTGITSPAKAPRTPWLALARGPALFVGLFVALLVVVAFRFAQPLEDGDLFWHMAYGAQMIQRGSLRTDHTLYSWMPASNATIYCAWTGELLFLGLWKLLGIAGIFALRYAVILAVLGLLARHAWRLRLIRRAEFWLVALVMLLASVVGTLVKPEMLSLLLWNALVFCGFSVFVAVEFNRSALLWIYAIPALMLIWVNTHGGFILAAPFVALIAVAGFWMLPKREARHLALAAGLCVVVTAINPYGINYPLQLLTFALGLGQKRPDIAWNNAYQSTWAAGGMFYHLPELLAWMTVGLAVACFTRRRGWILVAVLFLAYVPLYLIYVRSTFFLPAIFGYGVLYLMRGSPPRTGASRIWMTPVVCVLFVALGGRAVYQAAFHPATGSWMGFGIGYLQPVYEAEYLAAHSAAYSAGASVGPNLYNTYNAGGYLIWRLYPRYKVMVDARSFPYVDWFDELYQFSRSQDPEVFRAFLARHPANVALLDFAEDVTWRSFLNTPGWRPVFYGPDAAVFLRTNDPTIPVESAGCLRHLRNAAVGFRIFNFARAVGDYPTAWSILDQLHGSLRGQVTEESVELLQAYRDAHAALRAENYSLAWNCFLKSFKHASITGRDNTILLLLKAMLKVQGDPQKAAALKAGLARLRAPN